MLSSSHFDLDKFFESPIVIKYVYQYCYLCELSLARLNIVFLHAFGQKWNQNGSKKLKIRGAQNMMRGLYQEVSVYLPNSLCE